MVQVVAVLEVAMILSILFLIGRAFGKKTTFMLAGWLAFTAAVAASGVLLDFEARPPRMMLVIAGSIVVFVLTTRGEAFKKALHATPAHWIVAVMGMRVPIELGLWALYREGRIPLHFTFEGRNFDILVGLTALPVAWLCFARRAWPPHVALGWNIAGIAILLNIVIHALLSAPTPFQALRTEPPTTIIATLPYIWLPGFLVPLAFSLHAASLRTLGVGARPLKETGCLDLSASS